MSLATMKAAWPLQMPAPKKFVLIALADRADEDGVCYPSVADISRRTCLGERAVQQALKYLENAGALERSFRTGRSTVFKVTPEAFRPPHEMRPRTTCTPAVGAGEGRTRNTPGPAPRAPHPRTTCTQNHQEQSVEPRSEEARASSGAAAPVVLQQNVDPVKSIFDRGVKLLGEAKSTRSMIGRLRKEFGDVAVMSAIARAEEVQPSDPVPWLIEACKVSRPDRLPDGELPNGKVRVDGIEYDQSVGWELLAAKRQRAAA